jgi:hypothetical protein
MSGRTVRLHHSLAEAQMGMVHLLLDKSASRRAIEFDATIDVDRV